MKTEGKYILINKKPAECLDLIEWAKWMEKRERHVANEMLGDVQISTVFLGIDHNFMGKNGDRPILFETMVFGGQLDMAMERYCTWEEAEAGHKIVVAKVKEAENGK